MCSMCSCRSSTTAAPQRSEDAVLSANYILASLKDVMSAPFGGPPDAATAAQVYAHLTREVEALKQLEPPRLHYHWYYAGPQANDDMWHAPQGLHDFMRAYYHVKSADWAPNKPHNLKAWTAQELALLPHYYVMPLHQTMAQARRGARRRVHRGLDE